MNTDRAEWLIEATAALVTGAIAAWLMAQPLRALPPAPDMPAELPAISVTMQSVTAPPTPDMALQAAVSPVAEPATTAPPPAALAVPDPTPALAPPPALAMPALAMPALAMPAPVPAVIAVSEASTPSLVPPAPVPPAPIQVPEPVPVQASVPAPPVLPTVMPPPPASPAHHAAPLHPAPARVTGRTAAPPPVLPRDETPPRAAQAPDVPATPPSTSNAGAEARYISAVHAAIERQKRNPDSAAYRAMHPHGTVVLTFLLNRAGQPDRVQAIGSSGSALLDRHAQVMLAALVFPPMPPEAFADETTHLFRMEITFPPFNAAE